MTPPDAALSGTALPDAARCAAIDRAVRHSPFLARLIARYPGDVALFRAGGAMDGVGALIAERVVPANAAAQLRQQRERMALLLGLADLAGDAPFDAIVRALSDFADRAIDDAVRAAFHERMPGAPVQGFAVLALGKLGSRELNYSSDIDPIILYDPRTLTRRERDDPGEVAQRYARRVTELLSARTGDGYVFRVDLRLRPSPEVTPVAIPLDGAIAYYEGQALAWEQAAFVRARVAAGDVALGAHFLREIDPFIWRRSLDYRQVEEIAGVSRRIRDHYASGQAVGPGFDVKRGRGGIREIEFYAQGHQLIHGGRDPALRVSATRAALAALATAGWIAPGDAAALDAAYLFQRTLEHRLQMVDDRQTHSIPTDDAALAQVAALAGHADAESLLAALRVHTDAVARLFDNFTGAADDAPLAPADDGALGDYVAGLGFADADAVSRAVRGWRSGKYRAVRSPAARDALEKLLPGLLEVFAAAPDPQRTVNSFDRLLEGLPSSVNFFHLLAARPALERTLAAILTHAPVLAETLGRRPALFDGLIDASVFDPTPDIADLIAEMRAVPGSRTYERLLDHVRRIVGERRFALGVQIVEGTACPLSIAHGYAHVAEAALVVLTDAAVAEFERAHGKVAGSELVIVALGRLGGGGLTHASDLDLVYLFTGDHAGESDGPRPLGTSLYFNRLAQRVTAALSVPTATGSLYDVDTRLRPSGTQGPLAVTVGGFRRYQEEAAWGWEHMALTRARVVYGSPAARADVSAIIHAVLARPRDLRDLARGAAAMRTEMRRHKPPCGPLDAKLVDGGMVEMEFAAHVLQLAHGVGLDPRFETVLRALVDAGLAPDAVIEADRLLSRLLVTLRLVAPDCHDPPAATRALVARACRADDWPDLIARYNDARGVVRAWWAEVVAMGEPNADDD